MIKTFTEEQMAEWWYLRNGWHSLPVNGGIDDKTELNRVIHEEVSVWYEKLLRTADPRLLPHEDVALEVKVNTLTANSALLTLPERCIRAFSVRMADWDRTVYEIEPADERALSRETVRALASTPSTPHAYLCPDGLIEVHGMDRNTDWSAQRIPPSRVKPGPEGTHRVGSLMAVVRPEEGTYIFDSSLIETFFDEKREAIIG